MKRAARCWCGRREARLNFANFMRAQLFSAVASLKLGMDILAADGVELDRLLGHGGFFKTPEAGQKLMAAALGVPVSVMETAGEGALGRPAGRIHGLEKARREP